MIKRPFYSNQIAVGWEKRPVVWLSGVRRSGKTTLCRMIPNALYFNCELPSFKRRLADPEVFFDSFKAKSIIILDEIHKIDDPSNVLKIASDAFPHLLILATGSSTLSATAKFRDTLTGRKKVIHLFPVLWHECQNNFDIHDLKKRLLHGGLPETLLSDKKDPEFYAEWIDSFYARDVQELFNIRNRVGFLKLLHLILRQSGGLLDYTNLSKLSELSRPTVMAHVEAMSIANVLFLLPPFHGKGKREIVNRPKCYAFDTGFITFVKGWEKIRDEDQGVLWEHLVLDMLRTVFLEHCIYFWRDKSGKEMDFVIRKTEKEVDVVECKIDPDKFDIHNLKSFRELYPRGNNYVICPFIKQSYSLKKENYQIKFINSFL